MDRCGLLFRRAQLLRQLARYGDRCGREPHQAISIIWNQLQGQTCSEKKQSGFPARTLALAAKQ
jgi:hypothetical protein